MYYCIAAQTNFHEIYNISFTCYKKNYKIYQSLITPLSLTQKILSLHKKMSKNITFNLNTYM